MTRWISLAGIAAMIATGCGSDYNIPDVVSVDAMQGTTVVESITLSELSEDTFSTDIPIDVSFQIHFDETMDLTTARENIWIEDSAGTELAVTVTSRLEVVTVVQAAGPLAAGENHVLHIGDDIADIAGIELLNGYDISFYTAP